LSGLRPTKDSRWHAVRSKPTAPQGNSLPLRNARPKVASTSTASCQLQTHLKCGLGGDCCIAAEPSLTSLEAPDLLLDLIEIDLACRDQGGYDGDREE
jgi:hypothetical protein